MKFGLIAAMCRAIVEATIPVPAWTPPTYADIDPNPVTEAMQATGSGVRYDVGPGQPYEDIDDVPWGSLGPGDTVNIFYRVAPYTWKFGICARGTQTNWVIINGVTDANGNRPHFDFEGAPMAPSCQRASAGGRDVFGATPAFGEDLGCIVIKPPGSGAYHRPKYIRMQNLELKNASFEHTYTTVSGGTSTKHTGFGIYLLRAGDFIPQPDVDREDHIVFENIKATNTSQGIFTQQSNNSLDYTCHNVTIRRSYFEDNGVVGRPFEHNAYVQCTRPIVEFCYFGQLKVGAQGSAYKTRCFREVFRYNYVVAHARAWDGVHPEDQDAGVIAQVGEGVDLVYGNIFVNDWTLPKGGAMVPIHYGGDNSGEDDGNGTPALTPPVEYRQDLYFFNNTVINRNNNDLYRRMVMFDLSTTGQRVHAWNNIFTMMGGAGLRCSWVEFAGTVNLLGKNILYAPDGIFEARENADAPKYNINVVGELIEADPMFISMANGTGADWGITSSSPALNASSSTPTGLFDQTWVDANPVLYSPRMRSNGGLVRSGLDTTDIGACELDTSTPANTVLPSISGDATPGQTITFSDGTWSVAAEPGANLTYQRQLYCEDIAVVGATGTSFELTSEQGGRRIYLEVTVTNTRTGRFSTARSAVVDVAPHPNAPQNTAVPTHSGNYFVNGVTNGVAGTWTNSPDTYTYQWLRGGQNGTVAYTTLDVTWQPEDEGYSFVLRVIAENEFGPVSSYSVATPEIQGVQPLGPDENNVFTFEQPDGTLVGALNANIKSTTQGTTRFECRNDVLQPVMGYGHLGESIYYEVPAGDNLISKATIASGLVGSVILSVHVGPTSAGYWAHVGPTYIQVRREGTYLDMFAHGIDTSVNGFDAWIQTQGNTLSVWINGSSIWSTDISVDRLTANYSGIAIGTAENTPTEARVVAWQVGETPAPA